MLPTDDDIPEKPIGALFKEAIALQQAARWEDAAHGFDAVLARLDADSDREAEIALRALFLKITCLHEHGDAQATLAAYGALVATYGASDDEKTIGFVADAMCSRAAPSLVWAMSSKNEWFSDT